MSNANDVRKKVSDAYAEAISKPGTGCCGQSSAFIDMAGYTDEERAKVPEGGGQSFGCGNPLAFAEVKEGQTVLDLGSGAGVDLILAAEKVGPAGKVIGVDMTDEMIETARKNIAAAGFENVEIRKGVIEELPVETGTVDWVISNCVINLSPEKDKVFAEIARVLKPGGTMQVSDIVAENLPDWVRKDIGLYSSCVGGAVSESEYLGGLERAGLTEVKVVDRLVYEASQLLAFASAELSCCGGAPAVDAETAQKIIQALEGNVVSAKVVAKKPE
jgi:arsenite methyltransferase